MSYTPRPYPSTVLVASFLEDVYPNGKFPVEIKEACNLSNSGHSEAITHLLDFKLIHREMRKKDNSVGILTSYPCYTAVSNTILKEYVSFFFPEAE